MKAETVSLLRSPRTHENLRLVAEETGRGKTTEVLVSTETGERFLVHEGIPCLLDESRVTGFNKKYRRFYNIVAPLYDGTLRLLARLAGGTVDEFRLSYIRELEIEDGGRFLEVSVGTGANLRYLPPNAECHGLDISWRMLMRCRGNLNQWNRTAELVLGDAEELPYQDELFDSVLHVGGINAFNDRARAIKEMIRVAKPGCKVVIVDETAKLVEKFSWFPGGKRMMRRYRDRFSAPVDLVPKEMRDITTREIVHGDMYCLSFRKP